MYEYQGNALEKLCHLPPCELDRNYSKGDMSYIINSGAWGMIQLWMKIFRISGPFVGTVVLLAYSIDFLAILFVVLLFSILIDITVAWVHARMNFKLNERLIHIQGRKDNELRYLLQEMEFLVMNNRVVHEIDVNNNIVKEYWNVMWQMNLIDTSFITGTEMLGTLLRGYIFNEVKSNRDGMTSGQIGTINQIFANVRDSAEKTRNQIITLPKLLVPVERMNKLMSSDSQAQFKSLDWNEQSHIAVRNIRLSYEETNVIENMSLDINYGDKVAIIGSNGSGKSTLLKALLKIIEIKDGDIYVSDHRMGELSDEVIKDLFSFLPSNLLLFTTSVEENINMNVNENCTDQELQTIMRKSSFSDDVIDEMLHTKTKELSGGQAQRVSFGRMISKTKSIYLLDEPTSSLDAKNAKNIMEYVFNELHTYIYTTHNAEEIIYSNRVIYMESGEIICDLTREQFLQSKYYPIWLGKNEEGE